MKICAVIPAAGRGSRLGISVPKILAPVGPDATIWTILKDKLKPLVDHIHVVLSPAGEAPFYAGLVGDADRGLVSTSLQPEPRGMGDAIFRGYSAWRQADVVLIIWGDQVHVSAESLSAAIALHAGAPKRLVLPVVSLAEPYVEYCFDDKGALTDVLQSREGDRCRPGGLGDIGTFLLSTADLADAWTGYLAGAAQGAQTGEVNFLPFLVHLSQQGWEVRRHLVADVAEARGINTPDDLEFFRQLYRSNDPADMKRYA